MQSANKPKFKAPLAWLIRRSGPLSGTRHLVSGDVIRVGRSRDNDIVIEGADAGVVSSKHLEIRKEKEGYRLFDLNSTNGTFLDGQRISEETLPDHCTLQLGSGGPELSFEVAAAEGGELDKTMVAGPVRPLGAMPLEAHARRGGGFAAEQEKLLSQAIEKARLARSRGSADQTAVFMREVLGTVVRRSGLKFKVAIGALAIALTVVTVYGWWRIQDLQRQKSNIDARIEETEKALQQGGLETQEIEGLLAELERYQQQAQQLRSSMFYQFGVEGQEEAFIEHEIKVLMAEFGAETYSIPPEFVQQVDRFIKRYQGRDRPHMIRALQIARDDLETIQQILAEDNLPPDLAYMVLVESAFATQRFSPAGAAGPWQLTAPTARQYKLKVTEKVDERFDLKKSTEAAARYIRELILDFGSGSSVMLALAAYNYGPRRVKRAIRRVEDPIKQRNFWYLYRARALPLETRQYVPKIIAAMIIGRNPELYGFEEA